jgi:DNA-binding response OmpR family regulator
MNLLLIEDEIEIQSFLKKSLEETGYRVDVAPDAKTAMHVAIEETYDVLIVDLGLPDEDGLSLILKLRQHGVSAPLLILTARRSVEDRIRGLELGGGDYLTKPFSLGELAARLSNLIKNNTITNKETTRLQVLDIHLDLLRREASRSGRILDLTTQEFALLELFCRNVGRVVTRPMILDQVWGIRNQINTNIVEVQVCRLREKLDDHGQHPLIVTLRGMGYVLKEW